MHSEEFVVIQWVNFSWFPFKKHWKKFLLCIWHSAEDLAAPAENFVTWWQVQDALSQGHCQGAKTPFGAEKKKSAALGKPEVVWESCCQCFPLSWDEVGKQAQGLYRESRSLRVTGHVGVESRGREVRGRGGKEDGGAGRGRACAQALREVHCRKWDLTVFCFVFLAKLGKNLIRIFVLIRKK